MGLLNCKQITYCLSYPHHFAKTTQVESCSLKNSRASGLELRKAVFIAEESPGTQPGDISLKGPEAKRQSHNIRPHFLRARRGAHMCVGGWEGGRVHKKKFTS